MSFWKNIFGENKQGSPAANEPQSRQLPSGLVAKEFGEINVCLRDGQYEVLATILMEPQGKEAEGWQTGVALDASGSMKPSYGLGLMPGPKGAPTSEDIQSYLAKGYLQKVKQGAETKIFPTPQGEAALVADGFRTRSKNEIEPQARKFTAYLASNLDADGGTTVIYWAAGDGSQIEVIGDLTSDQCELAKFAGPQKVDFGQRTVLTPAVKYFVERFKDARRGMYVFITDGELHDLENVKKYTVQLCLEIAANKRNPVKCVLVGLGESINEGQMEQLDDLDSGTEIDIWDHKICKDMRSITEIFAEVVSENTIVAPTARILDASGAVVKNYTDGLPAKITFTMPASSPHFVLEVGGQKIQQVVTG